MPQATTQLKAILIPGNGGPTPQDNWFPYLEQELPKLDIKVINVQFPDPILARQEFWLPFIEQLGADANTILIGHSSGAVAAMRYAETHKILGSVLVGACYTDLGVEDEKASGYYDQPWAWDKIKNNQQWIALFASVDDPFIDIAEPRFLQQQLQPDYYEFANRRHFGHPNDVQNTFPELVEAIKKRLE